MASSASRLQTQTDFTRRKRLRFHWKRLAFQASRYSVCAACGRRLKGLSFQATGGTASSIRSTDTRKTQRWSAGSLDTESAILASTRGSSTREVTKGSRAHTARRKDSTKAPEVPLTGPSARKGS